MKGETRLKAKPEAADSDLDILIKDLIFEADKRGMREAVKNLEEFKLMLKISKKK